MELKSLKKIALFLIIGGTISTASAQVYSKIGEHPGNINPKAVLELESTSKGFLPPRMTKKQRDSISSPAVGLQVWCTDCNILTNPPSGKLYVYLGTGWAPFMTLKASVSTGKRTDPNNKPVRISATSATIKGTLLSAPDVPPTETGVVYREIIGNNFAVLPVLNDAGTATPPNYKTATSTPVTTVGGVISVTIPDLSSAGSGKRPFSFRAYAKNASGIGYGDPVVFNTAPPSISDPVVTNVKLSSPTFGGTLTVNAGTPEGAITEYGYCSSTTNNPPTTADNKVVLSGKAALDALDTKLNAESFAADPTIDLPVTDYDVKAIGLTYFRYYVVANGVATYSPVASFSPVADPVTGGTAIAKVIYVDNLVTAVPFRTNLKGSGTIKVNFNVTKAGTYAGFEPISSTGATKGLTVEGVPGGNFAVGYQSLTFTVSGTPGYSTEGNSFMVSRIPLPLITGPIEGEKGRAVCDGIAAPTTIVDITSPTGKIWMDRNLGASRKAKSVDDYEAYGCLFQWGRGNDGHASIDWTSSTAGKPVNGTTISGSNTDRPGHALFIIPGWGHNWRTSRNDNLWQGGDTDGINNPCPHGYRLPSSSELSQEFSGNGINNIWSGFSKFGLVASGFRAPTDGSLGDVGISGYYWTFTRKGDGYVYAGLNSGGSGVVSVEISMGNAVRCIKNY